eukprot:3055428-Rhodomonas_salina.6
MPFSPLPPHPDAVLCPLSLCCSPDPGVAQCVPQGRVPQGRSCHSFRGRTMNFTIATCDRAVNLRCALRPVPDLSSSSQPQAHLGLSSHHKLKPNQQAQTSGCGQQVRAMFPCKLSSPRLLSSSLATRAGCYVFDDARDKMSSQPRLANRRLFSLRLELPVVLSFSTPDMPASAPCSSSPALQPSGSQHLKVRRSLPRNEMEVDAG